MKPQLYLSFNQSKMSKYCKIFKLVAGLSLNLTAKTFAQIYIYNSSFVTSGILYVCVPKLELLLEYSDTTRQ